MLMWTIEDDDGNVLFDENDIANLLAEMKKLKLIPSRYQREWNFDKINESCESNSIKTELTDALFKNHSDRFTYEDYLLFKDDIEIIDYVLPVINEMIQMKHSTSMKGLFPTQKDVDREVNSQIIDNEYLADCAIRDVYSKYHNYTSDILSYTNIKKLINAMNPETAAFLTRNCMIDKRYWTNSDTNHDNANILQCQDDFDGKMFIESGVFSDDELEHINRVDPLSLYGRNKVMRTVPDKSYDSDIVHDFNYSVVRKGMSINDYLGLLKKVDSFLRSKSKYVLMNNNRVGLPSRIPTNENIFAGFDDLGEFHIYG